MHAECVFVVAQLGGGQSWESYLGSQTWAGDKVTRLTSERLGKATWASSKPEIDLCKPLVRLMNVPCEGPCFNRVPQQRPSICGEDIAFMTYNT